MARGRTQHPLRLVVSFDYWQSRNHASNAWTQTRNLECGHSVSGKGSAGEPRRARCTQCPAEVK